MKLSKTLVVITAKLILVLFLTNIPLTRASKNTQFSLSIFHRVYFTVQDTTKNITFSSVDLKTKDGKKVFAFVEQPPKFPGGDAALKEYLKANIPTLTGKGESVILNLIINEKGATEDITVIKPQGIKLGSEMNAVLEKMPLWAPGKQSGKPIPVSYTISIRY